MIQRFLMSLPILVLATVCVRAQSDESLPHYQPGQTVDGVIRIWGDDQMNLVMKHWQDGFRKYHSNVRLETKLLGSGTGMAGLYTGVADVALMGRDATPSEIMAFEWVFRYKPLGVEVATGSLDVPGKSFALAVFVNKDNPLSQLTLAQLDAIFGSEHLRGPRSFRTWGDLGLTGEWANQSINPYGYDVETGTGTFFRNAIFRGSDKWNCGLKEFADPKQPGNSQPDAGQRIIEALAHDRYGIAFSNLRYLSPQLKTVALATSESEPYYTLSKDNLIQRKYILTRATSIYVNRAPSKPIDPNVKEFLRYVLSQEGQQDIVREGDFLPLSEVTVREQLRKLE
jgi:phosphate transport system substrate-binding protein